MYVWILAFLLNILQVFQSKRSYTYLYYILAFGVPAVIVGVTVAATDAGVYGTRQL